MPVHLNKIGQQPYCLVGTEGAEIIDGLYSESEVLISKKSFSGFFGTDLAERLADIPSVILAGIATDCCILATALDAASHGRHVYVPYQAVSAANLGSYSFGLDAIAKSAAAIVEVEAVLTGSDLWEVRLQSNDVARDWYTSQLSLLTEFRSRRGSDQGSVAEEIGRLEEFLAGRHLP